MSIKIMSAVFDNEELGPTPRLILLALADHADDAGRCYPSIARLCRRTGLGERAVRKNLRDLERAGYVTTHIGAGTKGANVYFVRATPAPDAPRHEMPPAPDAPPPGTKCPTPPAPDAPKPPLEPSENHHTPYSPPPAFDDFWKVVPRRVAKGAASKAWAKAVKKVDPEAIIAAMQAYAASREGEDPQYTVHPATWLNQERWDDDPPPARGASQKSFHDHLEQMLNGDPDGLQRADSNSGHDRQRLSAPVSPPGPSGRRDGGSDDTGHFGQPERPVLSLVKPRRFGGTG